jgi:hypothetical protein
MRALVLWPLLAIAGCGGSRSEPATTGLTIAIYYSGPVASVRLSGDAKGSMRSFGPYVVSTARLGSGDTVGLILDPSDAGDATVCAEAVNSSNGVLARGCVTVPVVAGKIEYGAVSLFAATMTAVPDLLSEESPLPPAPPDLATANPEGEGH